MSANGRTISPRTAARIAGVLYLVIIAGGLFAEVFVRERMMVPGDAATTARNILDNELLFRLGFAVHLGYLACAVPVAVILYGLLKRVDLHVALTALLFNAIAITVEGAILLNQFAPLRVLGAAGPVAAEQVQFLAYTYLRLFSSGFGISLTFFGFFCLFIGYLIYRSGFLPRLLGILMALAGLCYLVNSFTVFVVPTVAAQLFPYILLPCLLGELALALWLAVVGIDVRKWSESAVAQG